MTIDPLNWIDEELTQLDRDSLRRKLTIRGSAQTAQMVLDGQKYVNFGSNDYLGLAADPRLVESVERSCRRGGWGSGASPLVTGRSALHAELERRLATFEGCQAALLFPSGFAANAGTIPALVGKQDVIFSDAKNHASMIDGCRLSGAEVRVYPHGDVEWLRDALTQTSGHSSQTDCHRRAVQHGRRHCSTERAGPAGREIRCHADDRRGPFDRCLWSRGRGVAEHLSVEDGVHVRVGTLSKAFGSSGGFVAGSRTLIDWLANRVRSYVFSTAAPAAMAAASLTALGIVRDEPERRQRLLNTARRVREQLQQQGWDTGHSASQIIPVMVGQPETAIHLAGRLKERGLFVPCIRPPTVPHGESLLRISLTYSHDRRMIEQLLEGLAELRSKLLP